MRKVPKIVTLAVLATLAVITFCGCASNDSSKPYGNLPVGKPGPANAIARSVPTLTASQRQQVMIRKFGDVAATQSPTRSN